MAYEPKPGQFLRSSCAGEDIYEIVGAGKDENGFPTIDVRVLDVNDLLHFEHNDDGEPGGPKFFAPLTRAELPGVSLILRGMQWHPGVVGGDVAIVVNAPKGGCFRCCYLLWVYDSPGGKDPVHASEDGFRSDETRGGS